MISFPYIHRRLKRLGPLIALLFALGAVRPAAAEEKFNLDRAPESRDNLLSLIFGTPPPMATERGILLIDAFRDDNGNGRRDPGEKDLAGQISCQLDGIDYTVPAFIPGLKYEASYQLACDGKTYRPNLERPDLFVAQRGEILRVDIPCRPAASGG